MPRVTLSDGRWLELRPIYVSDRLAVIDLQAEVEANPDRSFVVDYLKALAAIVEGGTTAKSWDGSLLEMPEPELLTLMSKWRKASEDDAVPPASGTPSEGPSQSPESAAPMESQPE